MRECMGPTSAALKRQLRRIQSHLHPLAQRSYQGYKLNWRREVARLEVMQELTGSAHLHQRLARASSVKGTLLGHATPHSPEDWHAMHTCAWQILEAVMCAWLYCAML
eukprot:3124287-Amphidinium_carterae.2